MRNMLRLSFMCSALDEEIRDLLSPDYKKKLELKENSDRGVYVAHLR